MANRPNLLLIINDDMGYSDIGCYGGEIDTTNLNRLAENGIRFTQFYNTARCSPSRASLLTGLHPHQTGIGILTDSSGPDGYPGNLNQSCVTAAEALKISGYRTYMSGKWHLAQDMFHEKITWPKQRGFDRFYGTIAGSCSYYAPITLTRDNENIEIEAESDEHFYYTDVITENAVQFISEHFQQHPDRPFFQYVAYTAPHWPLHAKEQDILKYKGRFDKGWDELREERLERMTQLGILKNTWELSERDPSQPEWKDAAHKEWRLRCMEVYAAQIDRMDQGIGRIIKTLEENDQLDNTLIIFLADNGGCAEVLKPESRASLLRRRRAQPYTRTGEPVQFGGDPNVMPGPENTYQSYGIAWANLSNTPFKLYKHWVHEGGISTPFIVHWPQRIKEKGVLRHHPCQLTDVLPTLLEAAHAKYPQEYNGNKIIPMEGTSMLPLFSNEPFNRGPMFWEHEGNAAVRMEQWKLVRKFPGAWELYDMNEDRTEMHDLSGQYPEKVSLMSELYEKWARRCGVIPRETILESLKKL